MGDNDSLGGYLGAAGTQIGNIGGIFDSKPLGVAGNALSGIGKLADGQKPQGVMEVFGAGADYLAMADDSIGWAGPVFRAASAGITIGQNSDQCSVDAPMADNACYTAMGDMAFAGAEVAFPVGGTIAKFGLDALGALAGWIDEDYGFSSGSAAGAAIHVGGKGLDAAADVVGPYLDPLYKDKIIEFSPTGVPMTVAPPTEYTADPDAVLEEIEASADPTWASPYRR